MGEIKGQLLGILLVVAVFGIISVALVNIFNSETASIQNAVSEQNSSWLASEGSSSLGG